MKEALIGACVLLLCTILAPAKCDAQTIKATQVNPKTINVVVPGKFETDFTMRKGFGATWFDLKHDPEKKRDLAPVLEENGFLWTKTGNPEGKGKGGASWYANPPQKMELLESGPVRVKVRLSGLHAVYGSIKPNGRWKELGFEQTFTAYPTGDVYVDYALVNDQPVPLHHFSLILKTTGAWGKEGAEPGRDEVHWAAEGGPDAKGPTSFVMHWSNGPTYFTDILMVMYKGSYGKVYWNRGYKDKDVRAGFNILSRWPDKTIAAGGDRIRVLMRFDDDVDGYEAAKPYAEDYRSPDQLEVTKGKLEKSDKGDLDGDGFNESEGCYVLKSGAGGVAFRLQGKATPRMSPVFKVKDWQGDTPKAITLGGKPLVAGKDFNASVKDGVLLLQLLEDIKEDVEIVIK